MLLLQAIPLAVLVELAVALATMDLMGHYFVRRSPFWMFGRGGIRVRTAPARAKDDDDDDDDDGEQTLGAHRPHHYRVRGACA